MPDIAPNVFFADRSNRLRGGFEERALKSGE